MLSGCYIDQLIAHGVRSGVVRCGAMSLKRCFFNGIRFSTISVPSIFAPECVPSITSYARLDLHLLTITLNVNDLVDDANGIKHKTLKHNRIVVPRMMRQVVKKMRLGQGGTGRGKRSNNELQKSVAANKWCLCGARNLHAPAKHKFTPKTIKTTDASPLADITRVIHTPSRTVDAITPQHNTSRKVKDVLNECSLQK
ncbi:unnamed protein product [Toxocara canis]|uniref:Uncharacterized protein n=1 Tax=Toxocara canis TaxID=6265 RepID=A0A183UD49_TOXCA|nr:unnamed protein product [Toxocara canis]